MSTITEFEFRTNDKMMESSWKIIPVNRYKRIKSFLKSKTYTNINEQTIKIRGVFIVCASVWTPCDMILKSLRNMFFEKVNQQKNIHTVFNIITSTNQKNFVLKILYAHCGSNIYVHDKKLRYNRNRTTIFHQTVHILWPTLMIIV